MSILGAVPEGLKVIWQVAVPIGIGGVVIGARVQGDPAIVPAPELVTVTVPAGLMPGAPAEEESVTVAVQIVLEPTMTGDGVQAMLVEVFLALTLMVTVLLALPLWLASPA